MFTHDYFEPYQVNSFVYCRRKWYYQNQLKFHIEDDMLELGRTIHKTYNLRNAKFKELYLVSDKWKLKGKCDYVLEEGVHLIPLELKIGKCTNDKPFINDTMQLMCYVLLLEEHLERKVPYGYVHYLGSRRRIKVKTTFYLRSQLQVIFKQIKSYMLSSNIPARNNKKVCRGKCSYSDCCWSR